MLRHPVRTALLFALALLSIAAPGAKGREKGKDLRPAEKEARDVLDTFDKNWKEYTNEPNYGDPRWKLKMETLVRLAQAGQAAVLLLEEAAKESSSWAPHTRILAAEVLAILRGPAAVRDTLADFDLNQVDTAHVGKPAPDFSLADASGQSYRLSQIRSKNTVVLTFVIQDI
jgi:hypothetical protein